MSPARREWAFTIAVVAAAAVLPWVPSLTGAERSHVSLWPQCLEPRIAAGDVYPIDRGLALAVTRGIASDHPEVAPLVDAVSSYEAAHPMASEDTFDGDGPVAIGPLYFTLVVVVLADRPELAPPELTARLEQVGAGRDYSLAHGGMTGIFDFLLRAAAAATEGHFGPGSELFYAVAQKTNYVLDGGIVGSDEWRNGYGSDRLVFGCDDERKSLPP